MGSPLHRIVGTGSAPRRLSRLSWLLGSMFHSDDDPEWVGVHHRAGRVRRAERQSTRNRDGALMSAAAWHDSLGCLRSAVAGACRRRIRSRRLSISSGVRSYRGSRNGGHSRGDRDSCPGPHSRPHECDLRSPHPLPRRVLPSAVGREFVVGPAAGCVTTAVSPGSTPMSSGRRAPRRMPPLEHKLFNCSMLWSQSNIRVPALDTSPPAAAA